MKKGVRSIGVICLFIFFLFLSTQVGLALTDANGNQLPDLVPLPAPKLDPAPLNNPPETYSGQVIIKYTQNYKEFREDGLSPDEKTLTVNVVGTIYPEYASDYRSEMSFTGNYLFKEGQMSWNYNAKNYDSGSCNYLFTSTGAGNIDIAHTDKIYLDSEIWLETDGEYTIDINNYGRIYLTADDVPIEEGDYDSAQKPVQTTAILISGDPKSCSISGAPTKDVPPEIQIRLENLKANNNILSGEEVLHPDTGVTEMISYTIELPAVKDGDTTPEEPAMSNNNPDKQGLLDIFFNWIKNLFR